MKVRLIDAALLECETEGTCVKVPLRRSRKQSRLQADHDDLVARYAHCGVHIQLSLCTYECTNLPCGSRPVLRPLRAKCVRA